MVKRMRNLKKQISISISVVYVSLPIQMTTRVFSADELEVCEQVGKGGFGIVYRGLIRATNEEVAIKQIDLENDQSDLSEINKEIQIISECRLPQITRFMGCFVKNYKLWVIMEYVNGGSLFELLSPGPVTDEKTILVIGKQILLALEYLHNQGKIHRDLKSQNILLSSKGEVKLTDFGVSTQLSSNFSRRNTTVGTPYWMAPEVIVNNNGGHNSKADIWSLGCCLFELFNGKPPLQNHYSPMKALRYISRCVKEDDFTDLIELDSLNISSLFKDFLKKCFTIDSKLRPGAKALLKHKFIVKNSVGEIEQTKLIKSLITNKHLWDQEHHVMKTQKFYLPTEIVNNQKKWQESEEDEQEDKTIKFDISTLNPVDNVLNSRDSSPSTVNTVSSSTAVNTPEPKKLNYNDLTEQTSKQKNLHKTITNEMNRILNKIFYKTETKCNLTTEQYDNLVKLNESIMNLLTFLNEAKSSKLLIFQYLKYFLKEIMKEEGESRMILQRMILPSELKEKDDTIRIRGHQQPFDDIENSLFDSWINEMRNNE